MFEHAMYCICIQSNIKITKAYQWFHKIVVSLTVPAAPALHTCGVSMRTQKTTDGLWSTSACPPKTTSTDDTWRSIKAPLWFSIQKLMPICFLGMDGLLSATNIYKEMHTIKNQIMSSARFGELGLSLMIIFLFSGTVWFFTSNRNRNWKMLTVTNN